MLSILLAALQKQQYNLRILHWKATGLDFHTTHVEILDGYIDKFGEYIDKVAEMMILCNEEIPTAKELDIIASKYKIDYSIAVKNYKSEDIFIIISRIFNTIISCIKNCNKYNYPSYIKSELDSIEYWFQIEGRYKTKQTLQ